MGLTDMSLRLTLGLIAAMMVMLTFTVYWLDRIL